MKTKWIVGGVALAVAVAALVFVPRYALVGIVCALAGWVGHRYYTTKIAEQ